jgi:hypothetical protein
MTTTFTRRCTARQRAGLLSIPLNRPGGHFGRRHGGAHERILAPTTPDLAHIDGSYRNPAKIREPTSMEDDQGNFRQKVHLLSHALPIAPSLPRRRRAEDSRDQGCGPRLILSLMLKGKTLAYDGCGNADFSFPGHGDGSQG